MPENEGARHPGHTDFLQVGPDPPCWVPGLTATVTTSRKEIPSVHRGGTRGPLKGPQCRQQASGSARGSTELVPAHAGKERCALLQTLAC